MIGEVTHERFVHEVGRRAAIEDTDVAERACEAALNVLGARLGSVESDAIAESLPAELGDALRRRPFDGKFGLDELYERIAKREGVDLARAREHAQAVLSLVAEVVDDESRKRLESLPDDIAALFRPRVRPGPVKGVAPAETEVGEHGRSVAVATPGGSAPLNEATGSDLAHRDSIAVSDEPRRDRKMSSGHAERSLSEGEPR